MLSGQEEVGVFPSQRACREKREEEHENESYARGAPASWMPRSQGDDSL
jgi:hypothetical protein